MLRRINNPATPSNTSKILALPVPGSKQRPNDLDNPLQLVASKVIGRTAVKALLHADEVEYKIESVPLAGDSTTPRQAKKTIKEATGRDMPAPFGTFGSMIMMNMKNEVGLMFG